MQKNRLKKIEDHVAKLRNLCDANKISMVARFEFQDKEGEFQYASIVHPVNPASTHQKVLSGILEPKGMVTFCDGIKTEGVSQYLKYKEDEKNG